MDEGAQYLILTMITALFFAPLVIAKARQEPPYNPHSRYWKEKNRRRGV